MRDPDALLHAALRAAPRRFRMPPLPATPAQAAATGPEAALAFAMEALRSGQRPSPALQDLFTSNLAMLIRQALAVEGGDAAFQALVLQAHEPEVAEHVRLSAQAGADRRAVRAALDAVAHPGKLRGWAPGPLRSCLAHWHALSQQDAWGALAEELTEALEGALDVSAPGPRPAVDGGSQQRRREDPEQPQDRGQAIAPPLLRHHLAELARDPALQRLVRGEALRERPPVQRYLSLCAQRGPLAGSRAAAAEGRASARRGGAAEQKAYEALVEVALHLQRHAPAGWRALRGLRTPPGFPGEAGKAKDEWDVALVRDAAEPAAAEIVLLVEVKVSPAAATPDFARLQRGLQRFAHARPQEDYAFGSVDGPVHLMGASLARLQPQGRALPDGVIYCCAAPSEPQPPWLSAASKAVLLAEPESLAYARQWQGNAAAAEAGLGQVWQALLTAPRLRAALNQYDTARSAREAMLHPQDLVEAVLWLRPRSG